MEFKSLVLITLVAGFVLVSAENESLEELLRRMLIQMDQSKADADAFLQTQKANAALAGYTVIRGVIISSKNGKPVSSTDTDFALDLENSEGPRIASAFKSGSFAAFQRNGVSAEGVTYTLLAAPENGQATAAANGKLLHMKQVDLGISVILMVKNEVTKK